MGRGDMSRIDLHPEELLDRAQSGTASKEELLRLEAHLASCRACRFERALVVDSALSTAPRPGDDLLVDRIRASVVRALAGRSQKGRRRELRKWAALACAATLLVTTIGAATVILRERHRAELARARAQAAMEVSRPGMRSLPAAAKAVASEEASPTMHDPAIGDSETQGAKGDVEEGRARSRSSRSLPGAAKPIDTTAAELFARANQLRRSNEVDQAMRAYRELQQAFPGSSEAMVSRVALGRLLLDRLGDARAALAQFDAYLASSSQGALGEEALIGRALSLGRLGRAAEEQSAWSALLASHPRSTYAARARARIEQLSTK